MIPSALQLCLQAPVRKTCISSRLEAECFILLDSVQRQDDAMLESVLLTKKQHQNAHRCCAEDSLSSNVKSRSTICVKRNQEVRSDYSCKQKSGRGDAEADEMDNGSSEAQCNVMATNKACS